MHVSSVLTPYLLTPMEELLFPNAIKSEEEIHIALLCNGTEGEKSSSNLRTKLSKVEWEKI